MPDTAKIKMRSISDACEYDAIKRPPGTVFEVEPAHEEILGILKYAERAEPAPASTEEAHTSTESGREPGATPPPPPANKKLKR